MLNNLVTATHPHARTMKSEHLTMQPSSPSADCSPVAVAVYPWESPIYLSLSLDPGGTTSPPPHPSIYPMSMSWVSQSISPELASSVDFIQFCGTFDLYFALLPPFCFFIGILCFPDFPSRHEETKSIAVVHRYPLLFPFELSSLCHCYV